MNLLNTISRLLGTLAPTTPVQIGTETVDCGVVDTGTLAPIRQKWIHRVAWNLRKDWRISRFLRCNWLWPKKKPGLNKEPGFKMERKVPTRPSIDNPSRKSASKAAICRKIVGNLENSEDYGREVP